MGFMRFGIGFMIFSMRNALNPLVFHWVSIGFNWFLNPHIRIQYSRRVFLNRRWPPMLINMEGPAQSSTANNLLDCGCSFIPGWLLQWFAGWWFAIFFIFPYIGNNNPNWLIVFRGVETTNQFTDVNSFSDLNCFGYRLWLDQFGSLAVSTPRPSWHRCLGFSSIPLFYI